MSWPMVKLKDVSKLIDYGLTASADVDCDGPLFLRITDLGDDGVNWSKVPRCVCDDKKKQKNLLEKGDIVFARTGATTGKSYLISDVCEDTVFASYLIRVRPTKKVHSPFLAYFFKSPNYWYQIGGMSSGATLPGVNASKLSELEIPLPPLDEQKRIAKILDKADAIRQKRKHAIALADEFLHSVFLEMFGDPVTNPKGFPLGTIRDLVESANYGTSGKASESEGEYPVLRMGNITYQGSWDFSDLKYIDLTEKELPKYLVHKGDLLFNRTNSRELVGKTAVYEEELPMAFAGYLVRVRANEMGNTYYLSGYLNSGHGKKVLSGMCKSIVGMANINAQELQNIKLLLPPIELQNRYEKIVKAVRSRVSTQIVSLTELNELFSSLSQKAFSGQL
ncbi:restriction endonuclease subunit S [Vibrio jasicida]|uniref:restriction endonuclease subunit S n=1 Tax=Vibrio jasicida TaxID=766224 RepID=UPI000CE432EA|nr:restriction endonuclease subunit S [Vibrio jasicida]